MSIYIRTSHTHTRRYQPFVGSTKSLSGHALGAAGVVETQLRGPRVLKRRQQVEEVGEAEPESLGRASPFSVALMPHLYRHRLEEQAVHAIQALKTRQARPVARN